MNAKTFAFVAVGIMLLASCGSYAVLEDDREPDGIVPVIVAVLVSGAVGGAVGWSLHDYLDADSDQPQEYLRLASANNMADVMAVASVFTANSNSNYAQLWGMTKEHWMRQAELEAFSLWSSGKKYVADAVLEGSAVYENNSVMSSNAVAQFDSFLEEVSDKTSKWAEDETYSGKMTVGFALDNTSYTSSGGFDARILSVAESKGTGKIYIGTVGGDSIVTSDTYAPAYIINYGPRTVISGNGLSYAIESGMTYLEDLYSVEGHKRFASGVYTVTDATLGGDSMSPVIGGIQLQSAMSFDNAGKLRYAVLDGETVRCDSMKYGSFGFKAEASGIPDGESNPDAVDLLPVLKAYQKLLDKLYWTTVSANNSARAVWDIYDRADAKDYGVTTLMSSNVYDSVVLSDSMNEVMTLSAMQQLADYYGIHSDDLADLTIGLYADGMDAPFVRGSIIDRFGNTVYDDVIFTPFFQFEDVTLQRGTDYRVDQNTFIAIWHDGMELTAWHRDSMSTEGYKTAFIEDGYVIRATQLAQCDSQGMHNQASIDFKVTKVRYIDPGKAGLNDDIGFHRTAKNILQTLCLIVGAVLIGVGILRKEYLVMGLGIALVVFSVLFADPVWAWITSLGAWNRWTIRRSGPRSIRRRASMRSWSRTLIGPGTTGSPWC